MGGFSFLICTSFRTPTRRRFSQPPVTPKKL
nr:MAG TPA: hypothetical protein [Caudoviricetes sp.]